MKKNAAIALARKNGVEVKTERCIFSNVNRGPKNVWWFDIPIRKAVSGVVILLCDGENKQLYCLNVPGNVFRGSADDFFCEEVGGVDKYRIEPSALKKDFMKDRRTHSAGVCFYQFVERVVAFD